MNKEETIQMLKDNPIKIIKCGDVEIPVEYLRQTTVNVNGDDYIRLQQENKKLNGAIQTYDILLKANTEENKRLKDNWNKLRKWIVYNKHNENTEQHYLVVDYGTLLGKMQELEKGVGVSDDNN